MQNHTISAVIATLFMLMSSTAASANESETSDTSKVSWRQLGAHSGHAIGDKSLPSEWSDTKNVAWKTPIPGSGWSSPIVDGNEIWLTTSIDQQRSLRLLCLDASSGKIRLNVEVFSPDKLVAKHARNGHATPTPVLDDSNVYVHFGSYGTAALDRRTAEILWTNKDTVINHQWGPGSSPVLLDDMVVFNCDGMEQRYVIALNKKAGKQVWKTTRSEKITKGGFFSKAFSTPSIVQVNGQTKLLSGGANQVTTFDPRTGKEGWSVKYFGYAGVTKPIIADGRAFVTSGYGDGSLMAIQLSDAHGHKSGELLWKTNKGAPIIPSPIVVGSELYMVSDNGVLSCVDAATGDVHWRERLSGNYAASITYGDGKLFVHNDKGMTTVFAPSADGFRKLSTNQLDSNIQASPALVDGVIFLRTKKSLYRIEES
ncbi:MAG: PQQ-binding-like beta-propeller repeat protein [Planctomycetota bacterium]